jgi:hypothetical protein
VDLPRGASPQRDTASIGDARRVVELSADGSRTIVTSIERTRGSLEWRTELSGHARLIEAAPHHLIFRQVDSIKQDAVIVRLADGRVGTSSRAWGCLLVGASSAGVGDDLSQTMSVVVHDPTSLTPAGDTRSIRTAAGGSVSSRGRQTSARSPSSPDCRRSRRCGSSCRRIGRRAAIAELSYRSSVPEPARLLAPDLYRGIAPRRRLRGQLPERMRSSISKRAVIRHLHDESARHFPGLID